MPNYGSFSPVPLGVSGTGAAVVLGDGLGALRYLQKTDALQAAIKARAQAAAKKEQAAGLRDFSSKFNLNDEAGVSFIPAVNAHAKDTYQKMEALAVDPTLNRQQKSMRQQELTDEHARFAKASVAADRYLRDTDTSTVADKRLNRQLVHEKLYNTLYEQNEDGTPKLTTEGERIQVSPLNYNTHAVSAALAQGNDHINTPELFSQFVDTLPDDSVTYTQQPLPGGHGFKRVAKSNVFELNDDGTFKLDAKTGRRVLKDTPEMLAVFKSDPLQRQWLEAEDARHEQQLAKVIEKMKANEPLTDEEQQVVAAEQSTNGRQLELIKRGLVQYGYGRQENDLLAKAAPRPHVGRTAPAPKFTQSGGTEFTPGVLGGVGVGGTQGVAHFGASTPLLRTTAAGKIEPYLDNAVHRDYLVQRGNGSAIEHITNNSNPQSLTYGGQVILLKSSTGSVVFPHDPKIIAASQAGDSGPLEAWARAERAKNPRLKPALFTQATPAKNADLEVGSEEEIYQEIKKSYTASGPSAEDEKYLTDDDRRKRAKMASMMAAFGAKKGGGATKRPLTEPEMRAAARKIYSEQNATLYIPYIGESKRRIDATTGFLLRKPRAAKAMAEALDAADKRTQPDAAESRQVTAGRGPLAGLLQPTAPVKATPKPAAAPAAVNRYGFKFKK